MVCWSAIIFALAAAPSDVVSVNGTFEKGFEGWGVNIAPPLTAETVSIDGRTAARITAPAEAPVAYPGFWQEYLVAPGALVFASVEAMGRGVRDGYGVYMTVEFHTAGGKRISFLQSDAACPDGAWRSLRVRAIAPPEAVTARLCLLLNGHGQANFARVNVATTPDDSAPLPDGPVTLTVTNEKVCASLKGFGAEDDGWFYNKENAAHGVTPDDWVLREDRIRWMQPDWIRMFFWYKDWNPSGDWETFDFESDNMRSHYRTLDLYQALGACVNVVGVEWNVPQFKELEKMAKAIGALLDHLTRTKGFSCVQEWTLTNEPNGSWVQRGNTFEDYIRVHELVKEEFRRRGLSIRVLGSDDTSGLSWFENCVRSDRYFGCADYFASHVYTPFADRRLAPFFFDERLDLLRARTPERQFIIAEFGFQDGRSGTLDNPVMESYPYAVWTSAFVIQGLNKGLAGFSIWCLHEVYYLGNGFMNYGLWNYKDRNWGVRPIYTAWANFTRHTKVGDAVYRCASTAPGQVLAARVGDTLFWVNQAVWPVQVRISGVTPAEAHAYAESTLAGDRECGVALEAKNGLWTLPAESFGRMGE